MTEKDGQIVENYVKHTGKKINELSFDAPFQLDEQHNFANTFAGDVVESDERYKSLLMAPYGASIATTEPDTYQKEEFTQLI